MTIGSVDLIGGYWQSPTPSVTNSGSVDLDGNSPGAITQSFTAPAGTYDLSFFLSGNPDGLPTTKTLDVSVALAGNVYTYSLTSSNSEGNMLYVSEVLPFTIGTPGTYTLTFTSLDTNSPYGPVIGGVDISATPLPSTWTMLIAGFVGLGFFAYRGSKKDPAVIAAV